MADPNRDEIARLELLQRAHPDGLIFPYLAEAYRKNGQLDRAEDVLLKGLSKHRDHSSAHVVLGRVRMDKGEAEEAETAFRRVLQLDPNNVVALHYLGELSVSMGRLDDAAGYLQRLHQIHPNDDEVRERIDELERGVVQPRSVETSPAGRGDNGNERGQVAFDDWAPPSASLPSAAASDIRVTNGPPTGSAGSDDEGEVFTETMAELYTRQGFYDRAVRVYRRLLAMHPGEPRLTARLEEVQRLRQEAREADEAAPEVPERAMAPDGPDPAAQVAGESAPPPTAADTGTPEEAAAPFSYQEDEAAVQASDAVALAAVPEDAAVSVAAGIGTYLTSVLDWTPDPEPREARSDAESVLPDRPVEAPSMEEPEIPEAAAPSVDVAAGPPGDRAWPWDAAPVPKPEPEPELMDEMAGVGFVSGAVPAEVPEVAAEPAVADAAAAEREVEQAHPALAGVSRPQVNGRLQAQPEAILALTDLLVGLLEFRDPFFRGGSSLTRLLAAAVGREMKLSEVEVTNLALAAVLRDLGRLALGGKLVSGGQVRRTPEARRRIERHVDLALHLMEGIDLPASVRYAVRHHHERWDGRGYPDGLAGEQIPLSARILAVVDSFGAMVAARPYRLPRKVPEAAAELHAEAGTRYDPRVVDALLRVLERRDQPHLGFVLRHHIVILSPDQPGSTVTAAKLCSAGYLAEVATDAESAWDRLRRVPVAALVVEAELHAEDDAGAFLRELRADPSLARLPVVVVDAAEVERRVELLECGADVCFAPDASFTELHGTLGALIRRAFRRRPADQEAGGDGQSPWLALQGDIQDFPLSWLLQVMKYDSRTAAIGIRTATDLGVIYLEKGDARHAEVRGSEKGEAALRTMLGWRKGRFTVDPEAHPPEQTITTPITHLLLDEAVAEDHAAAGQIFGAVRAEG